MHKSKSFIKAEILLFAAVLVQVACLNSSNGDLGVNSPAPRVIDDFERGDLTSAFGSQWATFTDEGLNGKSSASIELLEGGAAGSRKALRISGRVTTDFKHGFAGAGTLFQADVATYHGIRFYARGDGQQYQVEVLCKAVKDHNEFAKQFAAAEDWTLIEVPFSQLAQSPWWGARAQWTGTDVTGISFRTVNAPMVTYRLEIDELAFY
jgi:hypothetical protein